ncbi:MAG: hypothetical protein PHS54_01280 [Clostridia bacterium]|nr:hypothetical protein [Clostridia bacterium]
MSGNIKTNDGYFPTVKDFEDYWKAREKKAFKRGRKETIIEIISEIEERQDEEGMINANKLKKYLERK